MPTLLYQLAVICTSLRNPGVGHYKGKIESFYEKEAEVSICEGWNIKRYVINNRWSVFKSIKLDQPSGNLEVWGWKLVRKEEILLSVVFFCKPKTSQCLQSQDNDSGILQLLPYIINTVARQDLWFLGQQVLAMKPLPLVQRILGCLTVKWMEGPTFHLYLMSFCPEIGSCKWATWYVYRSIFGKAFLNVLH